MKPSLRSHIYNTVVQCRHLLERDMARQLEGTYGIHADGAFEPLESLAHLDAVGRADRRAIEAAICHEEAVGAGRREAVERYVRESAFTFLNRLAALKLMEHPDRTLIQPSVGAGDQSKGFQQFSLISPEAMRAQPDGGYRLYLELLFDDLSQTLGVLFDRTLPTSILFPTQSCLQEVLDLLNDPALEAVWAEDETIGWIYQYFTPTELREEARKASSAPRNSYELAFRNQFYTPRYVVAFLVDNTLGRLWWEMRIGDTRLTKQCRYLIRLDDTRKDRLTIDDLRLTNEQTIENRKSQIVNRNKRDPRELRILDPAGGSGHFLLYCFDLLLIIYEEAYDDPDLGPGLRRDFPDREGFRRAVPCLILEQNLHGIDVDLRAVQIAGFALWLRAQRAWAEMGLKMRQRPRIACTHVVCAEAMPGEYDLLGEFARDLKPAVLGNLVRDVWEKMRLAGEAGSLLKIEQEIRDSVRKARETLARMPPAVQLTLFGPQEPQQMPMHLDPRDLHDEAFWAEAEARVVEALRAYARRVGNGRHVSRRLFAEDALQGIAFVDLLQRPFDVVLMNPPFGAASVGSKDYIKNAYPRTKNDLYAAFVERGLELLREGGYLGAITSRTGFFLTSFRKWREEILLKEAQFIALADLGYGVLDTAMVETAAYVLRKGDAADE
ncbi:MAG: SAM-dependent methyltransferase [Chloroflexota bacterium]|nr:SAM-dependent methyltransferase [Chloroflexota bacterium]